MTYLPGERLLRWAYAGHPRALWLDDGREMIALRQGTPLGVRADPGCEEGSRRVDPGVGVLLYTDGLIEARRDGKLLGLDAVRAVLTGLHEASPKEAVAVLRASPPSSPTAGSPTTSASSPRASPDAGADGRDLPAAAAAGVRTWHTLEKRGRRGASLRPAAILRFCSGCPRLADGLVDEHPPACGLDADPRVAGDARVAGVEQAW